MFTTLTRTLWLIVQRYGVNFYHADTYFMRLIVPRYGVKFYDADTYFVQPIVQPYL